MSLFEYMLLLNITNLRGCVMFNDFGSFVDDADKLHEIERILSADVKPLAMLAAIILVIYSRP
jgi:hypothetical protein